jgi:hypothetical protein
MLELDYYHIVDSEVQHCLFCHYEKGEYEEGGWKGWRLTLCLRVDILWSMDNPN